MGNSCGVHVASAVQILLPVRGGAAFSHTHFCKNYLHAPPTIFWRVRKTKYMGISRECLMRSREVKSCRVEKAFKLSIDFWFFNTS
jgi:hypothetical protein